MVRSAEKAGFNPLTVLRNGGAAGFTTTSTPGTGGLGPALSAAGNFLQNFDPFADAKQDQASRLAEASINNLNAQTGSYLRTAGTPSGPMLRSTGVAGVSGALAGGVAAGGALPAGRVAATNPYGAGTVIDPTLPDADAWEQRLSDPGGWAGALVNLKGDMAANIAAQQKKRPMAPWISEMEQPYVDQALRGVAAGIKKAAPLNKKLRAVGPAIKSAIGNLPAGNEFQLPPLWPSYYDGTAGGF